MLKFCKKILSIGFCIILIVVICNLIVKKYYSNPHYLNSIITMQVGDDLQNYQFMNKLASKAYLTSIIKLNNKGSIEKGKDADLVIMDKNLKITEVFARGKMMIENAQIKIKGTFEGV